MLQDADFVYALETMKEMIAHSEQYGEEPRCASWRDEQGVLLSRFNAEQIVKELERLKIELSNYAYQIDATKRERDKAEAELRNRDQLAIEFADYMENERWKWDHQEQETHTNKEHWEHFTSVYYPR